MGPWVLDSNISIGARSVKDPMRILVLSKTILENVSVPNVGSIPTQRATFE
jgi:hypothetical protein